jgi:hypothetical protein
MSFRRDASIAALMVLLSKFPGTCMGISRWPLIVEVVAAYLLSSSKQNSNG